MLSQFARTAARRVATRAVVPRVMMGTSAVTEVGAAPPTVFDKTIQLIFVDPSGARRKVPGYVGKNLWDTCMLHNIDVGPASFGAVESAVRSDNWTEPLYGEGPSSGYDMVVLSGNGTAGLPPRSENEIRQLSHYWHEWEIWPESRLSCCIILTKEMDGMVVYVPDRVEDNIG